tara:strand:- start:29 stop:421 length:393 start_codon:yes stop_codon:yes gene_type:complete
MIFRSLLISLLKSFHSAIAAIDMGCSGMPSQLLWLWAECIETFESALSKLVSVKGHKRSKLVCVKGHKRSELETFDRALSKLGGCASGCACEAFDSTGIGIKSGGCASGCGCEDHGTGINGGEGGRAKER